MHRSCFLFLASLLLIVGTADAQPKTPPDEIRVRLLEQQVRDRVYVTGRDAGMALYAGDNPNPILRLQPREQVMFTVQNAQLHLTLSDGGIFAESVTLVPEGRALQVSLTENPETTHAYEGRLQVQVDESASARLLLINHVPLEHYVAVVVSGEYGLDDVEGARAQAVVARTFALRNVGRFGTYDVVDHVGSQVYHGITRLDQRSIEAAASTAGEVLTYNGALIEALYSSSSGGHTANNESIWTGGAPKPYLRGKPDPHDDLSPHSQWSSTVPRDRLLRVLSDARGFEVTGFFLGDRAEDGRVLTVDLRDGQGRRHTIPANEFRHLVSRHFGVHSVKSTNFEARREGGNYVFHGRGFGHGVGLSQWGAHSMAKKGYDYREILAFYYGDVALARTDGVAMPEMPPPVTLPAVADAGAQVAAAAAPYQEQPAAVPDPDSRIDVRGADEDHEMIEDDVAEPRRGTEPTERVRTEERTSPAERPVRPSGRRIGW
jgi:stage II sporulation protein D